MSPTLRGVKVRVGRPDGETCHGLAKSCNIINSKVSDSAHADVWTRTTMILFTCIIMVSPALLLQWCQ